MFKKKYKQFYNSQNKSKLDQFLWFIENHFLQKKDRDVKKNFYMDYLEAKTFTKFAKLASLLSKRLLPTTNNKTISLTSGNWTLPYIKLLKKKGISN